MEEASACRRVAGRASGAAEATPAGLVTPGEPSQAEPSEAPGRRYARQHGPQATPHPRPLPPRPLRDLRAPRRHAPARARRCGRGAAHARLPRAAPRGLPSERAAERASPLGGGPAHLVPIRHPRRRVCRYHTLQQTPRVEQRRSRQHNPKRLRHDRAQFQGMRRHTRAHPPPCRCLRQELTRRRVSPQAPCRCLRRMRTCRTSSRDPPCIFPRRLTTCRTSSP
jgi:hypothetical protein